MIKSHRTLYLLAKFMQKFVPEVVVHKVYEYSLSEYSFRCYTGAWKIKAAQVRKSAISVLFSII